MTAPLPEHPRTFRIRRIPRDVVARERRHPMLAGLIPTNAGFFPNAAGHRVVRDEFVEYLVIYCVAGRGHYAVNGRRWQVGPGDFLAVMPGSPHRYEADPSDPWTIHWAHFTGERAADFLELAGLTSSHPLISVGQRLKLINLFVEILETLDSGYSFYHLLAAATALRQVLSHIALVHRYSPPAGRKDVHVEETIHFMLEHLNITLTLDDLAAQAALSRSHFARRFHAKTGYAPIDYFIRLKIQRAGELLEGSDLTVAEVSRSLGYSDPYYFSRLFKKITGVAPTRYRAGRA